MRRKLGAVGSNLAALSWFFDRPYDTLVAGLEEGAQMLVIAQAALQLRAQGRLAEALPAMRAALVMSETQEDWSNAAMNAINLSQVELTAGAVDAAIAVGATSVASADRSDVEFHMVIGRTTLADALHAAGRRAEAEALFAEAERCQREWQQNQSLLYSLQGFQYCDLLLGKCELPEASEQAEQSIAIARRSNWLLAIALDTLTLGRASFGFAMAAEQNSADPQLDISETTRSRLDQAVDGLRKAGTTDQIPRGLLARAAFRRSIGDWDGATRDLDEVEEIAEPGPMRLYLCDMALERARLAFAKIEAFAPLNGMLKKDNPAKPAVPDAAEIARLQDEAAKQLAIAADYISTCGYHRRDEERDELQAVLRGERKFADLPPRV